MSEPLEVEAATVRFGATTALDGISLRVDPSAVMAVVGPSGSGKSTLLRAVAGLQRLDKGSVRVGGRDLSEVPPHRRGVGLMFQDHALFPHRDVAGNVGFGLRIQGLPAHEVAARVSELLELVDLSGFGRRAISTLSGGEQQRVALARTLAPRPSVLLLDEPLGALDRTLRDHLLTELRSLFTHLEVTVVAVTHDQREAFALADRVAVMDRGILLQEGAPTELWARPASARVARLLGFANVVQQGEATVMIRPTGVHLVVSSGPTGAVVVSSTFAGDRTEVRVEREGAEPLEAVVPSSTAPGIGAHVQVTIDPAAVVPLPS